MTKVTPRQREILTVISDYIGKRGWPPSIPEIGAEVGLGSPSAVHRHLLVLEGKGFLIRVARKPRALKQVMTPGIRVVPVLRCVGCGVDHPDDLECGYSGDWYGSPSDIDNPREG